MACAKCDNVETRNDLYDQVQRVIDPCYDPALTQMAFLLRLERVSRDGQDHLIPSRVRQ